MSVPDHTAGQHEPERVVRKVAEFKADACDAFDEQVDRRGGSVTHGAGGEVGRHLVFPGGNGAPEAGQLRDVGVGAGPVEAVQPGPGPVQVRGETTGSRSRDEPVTAVKNPGWRTPSVC